MLLQIYALLFWVELNLAEAPNKLLFYFRPELKIDRHSDLPLYIGISEKTQTTMNKIYFFYDFNFPHTLVNSKDFGCSSKYFCHQDQHVQTDEYDGKKYSYKETKTFVGV